MRAQRGVVLGAPGAVGLEEITVAAPGRASARADRASGVCHSDLHVIEEDGGKPRAAVLLGHEGAGTIEAIGPGSKGWPKGPRGARLEDRPAVRASMCKRGEPRSARAAGRTGRLHRHDGAPS